MWLHLHFIRWTDTWISWGCIFILHFLHNGKHLLDQHTVQLNIYGDTCPGWPTGTCTNNIVPDIHANDANVIGMGVHPCEYRPISVCGWMNWWAEKMDCSLLENILFVVQQFPFVLRPPAHSQLWCDIWFWMGFACQNCKFPEMFPCGKMDDKVIFLQPPATVHYDTCNTSLYCRAFDRYTLLLGLQSWLLLSGEGCRFLVHTFIQNCNYCFHVI